MQNPLRYGACRTNRAARCRSRSRALQLSTNAAATRPKVEGLRSCATIWCVCAPPCDATIGRTDWASLSGNIRIVKHIRNIRDRDSSAAADGLGLMDSGSRAQAVGQIRQRTRRADRLARPRRLLPLPVVRARPPPGRVGQGLQDTWARREWAYYGASGRPVRPTLPGRATGVRHPPHPAARVRTAHRPRLGPACSPRSTPATTVSREGVERAHRGYQPAGESEPSEWCSDSAGSDRFRLLFSCGVT